MIEADIGNALITALVGVFCSSITAAVGWWAQRRIRIAREQSKRLIGFVQSIFDANSEMISLLLEVAEDLYDNKVEEHPIIIHHKKKLREKHEKLHNSINSSFISDIFD